MYILKRLADTISHETGRPFIQDTIQETEPKWGLGNLVQMGSLLWDYVYGNRYPKGDCRYSIPNCASIVCLSLTLTAERTRGSSPLES